MEGFIKTTKGRLKKLLSEHGNYKSLNQFRKDLYETDGVNYTDKQLNKMLIEHHNETVKEIRDSVREQNKRRRDEIKEQNKNMNHLFKNIDVQPYNEEKLNIKEMRRKFYNDSLKYNFLIVNFPNSLEKCLKAIEEHNIKDSNDLFRNIIKRSKSKVNSYSFDISSIQDMKNKLLQLYKNQENAFKLSIQFSFVFEKMIEKDENEFTYDYIVFNSTKNKFYIESVLIKNLNQLKAVMNKFNIEDILTYIDSMKPSSAHKIIGITQMEVKIFDMEYRIGAKIELPDFILKNQNINSMIDSTNNMCFWNCLAFHKSKSRKSFKLGKELYETFYENKPNKNYLGFDIHNDLDKFENKFNIGVNIFELNKDNNFIQIRNCIKSQINDDNDNENIHVFLDQMNLLLTQDHFSYIRDIKNIEKSKFICDTCGHVFEDSTHLNLHNCKDFIKKDKFCKFPQVYEPARNLIIELNEIFETDCCFKYEPLIVYDFETKLTKLDKRISKNISVLNKHEAISVSIYSNVEGYNEEIFLYDENPKVLIEKMFNVFDEISNKARLIMIEKYKDLLTLIKTLVINPNYSKEKSEFIQSKYLSPLKRYIFEIPILGFNSGMYDINLNIKEFIQELEKRRDKSTKITAIKNGNSYKALILKNKYKFLDICQYIPPNYNLDKYIKAFNPNGLRKSIFPYEFLDSFEKLNYPIQEITRRDFYSTLKNQGITDDDWFEFKENIKKYNWTTLLDLLRYYNNLDVKPFLEAVINQRKFFYDLNIDMFKDGFSLPSLAEKIMFSYEFKEFNDTFIKEKIKRNNKTKVFDNVNEKLLGYIKQDKQRGNFDLFKFINEDEIQEIFKEQAGKCMYCWKTCKEEDWSLDRINNDEGHNIDNCVLSCIKCNVQRKDTFYNVFYRKKALVRYSWKHPLIYLIDEENKEVFYKIKENITGGASIVFHRYHEAGKTKIKHPIYEKGEWKEGIEGKDVKKIIGFDANALYLWCIGQDMLCGVLKYEKGDNFDLNKDFGMVEVDIETPEELYNEMGEFPLIFKNVEYDANEVMGDYMKSVYDEDKKRITRKLISSFKGEKLLIKSTRLKWLVEKGLKITKIHGYIKAQRGTVFSEFVEAVSNFRRMGDKDPKYAIIAEMWKLVGNSAFGRTGMNKNKFRETVFGDVKKYNKLVSTILFKDANEYDDVFEITRDKKITKQNIPIQVASSIYDDSKLKMSTFYYDFIQKYIGKENCQYIEMDTDSAYMAITADNFEELIKSNMKNKYLKDKYNWFLRNDTKENYDYDFRKPGLFKIEAQGSGMVALCSKTYYLQSDTKNKFSSKGVQSRMNDLNFELYQDVLLNGVHHIATNRGFRIMNNKMLSNELIVNDGIENFVNQNNDKTQVGRTIYMYEQLKIGITQKYDKRRVLNDKVSTVPLNI